MKRYNNFGDVKNSRILIGKTSTMNNSILEVGSDCAKIEIGADTKLIHAHITVYDGGKLVVGNMCKIRGRLIVGAGCELSIGNGLSCNNVIKIHVAEKGSVAIGNDCLFANPQIFNSDLHSIFSEKSGKRVNHTRNVIIGDRVWLATNTLILKGSSISNDSVVGAGAVVNGHHESNSVISGNPGKVTKRGISWSRALTEEQGIRFGRDFSTSNFKHVATKFEHANVIKMGLSYIEQWEKMDVNNSYVFYYLARSILLSKFNKEQKTEVDVNGRVISLGLISEILNCCYKISELKNFMCGSYYYMSLVMLGEKEEANKIYQRIVIEWPHIEEERFIAKWTYNSI